jgi:CHAT domain-containing protein
LLTSSEVAQLKIDADWVIMSACNTAAGENDNAEALSGLARAFFFAGAHALLVSHWYVDSASTQLLVTKTISVFQDDPSIGQARAHQRSMIDFIKPGSEPAAFHPAFWAPLVVVGEGTR